MFKRFFSILLIFAVALIPTVVNAQFEDKPTGDLIVDVGLSQDALSSTRLLTAIVPITDDGSTWAGFHYDQNIAEDVVVSEYVRSRLQGEFTYRDIGIAAYFDVERNKRLGISLQPSLGWFLRPGVYDNGTVRVSGGLGTFVVNTQVREELGLDIADPTVLRLLGFASLEFYGVSALVSLTPKVNLDDFQLSVEPKYTIEVSDRFSVGLSGRLGYVTDPITDTNLDWSWSAIGRISF